MWGELWGRIEQVTPPTDEPVSLLEARAQLRVDEGDEDALIQRLITEARLEIEGSDGAGVFVASQQLRLSLDRMPSEIYIPTGPVSAIDEIRYVDEAGESQTITAAEFQWRKGRYEAFIKPAYNRTWPTVRYQYNAVQVTFSVAPNESLEPLKQAILLKVALAFEDRTGGSKSGVVSDAARRSIENIVNKYRVGRF